MAAKESALGAIRDPVTLFSEQRTILSLHPIATLQETDNDIYTLLEIFQQGKLEDFQSFIQTHPHTLSSNHLSEQDAIRHMRLLSLCSLATEHEEIPYDAIATTLQVDQSEVESWVIDAVSSGLLSAKMDQLQHVVMVERCVVRRFGMEQWKVLQTRLDVWKKNVKAVLEGLKQSHHSQV
jgi:translation initiation factor 3 subunit M